MSHLSVDSVFDGFGPSLLTFNRRRPHVELKLPADDRSARRLIRRHTTATPGVYGMLDGDGVLIYVGMSKVLRNRLLSYFTSSANPNKGHLIAQHAERLVFENHPHELTAWLRELELIRRFQPRYNVQGQPGRRSTAFLCVGRSPAPYAFLATTPQQCDGERFGPVPAGRQWQQAVRRLNDCFRLRDCPSRNAVISADQLELFADPRVARCLRHDLGTCLAPCIAGCRRNDYDEAAEAARAFLRGDDLSLLVRLQQAMHDASADARYEQAAVVRDTLTDLTLLHQRLQRLRNVRESYHFVYPLPGCGGTTVWYLIRRGQVRAVARAPRDTASAERCQRLLAHVYQDDVFQDGPPRDLDHAADDLQVASLMAGWFHRHPEELRRTISPQEAL